MSILMLLLGIILGFVLKLGMDEYHKFKNEQEKTKEKMEEVLTRWKAMEILNQKIIQ